MQFDRVQSAFHERTLVGQQIGEPNHADPESVKVWMKYGSIINKKVLSEIHLYFIAIDNLYDMLKVILKEDSLTHLYPQFSQALKKYSDSFAEARNTFEHFEERIPNGKRNLKVKEVAAPNAGPRPILGGLTSDSYKFGDKEWPITPSIFKEILDTMDKFESCLITFLQNSPTL